MTERKVQRTMENETAPRFGTGDFPPPHGFDDAVYVTSRSTYGRSLQRYRSMSGRDPHMAPLKVVGLLCVSALAVLAIGIALWAMDAASVSSTQASATERSGGAVQAGLLDATAQKRNGPTSTPKSGWKAGSVPSLYQKDAAWEATPYADGTIGTHGCGPTCLSMAYVALTGNDDLDPRDMAEFSELNGFVDNGVTSWLLMSQGANLIGLDSVEVPASASAVETHLLADHPVICSVHAGDFTDEGHFIVLVDSNGDGTVTIRDPNSEDRTSQTWDLGRVIDQCDNIWALSV